MASSFQIETQEKLYWCWAAVAAGVAHYFSPHTGLTQCRIAKSVLKTAHSVAQNCDCCNDPGEACNQPAALEPALGSLEPALGISPKVQMTTKKILTFGDIRKEIDARRPVCVRIQWYGEPGGHFVILSGYAIAESGEQWVDVADPYYEDSSVPFEQFITAYLDAGAFSDAYFVSQG